LLQGRHHPFFNHLGMRASGFKGCNRRLNVKTVSHIRPVQSMVRRSRQLNFQHVTTVPSPAKNAGKGRYSG
jgi:hypothetical protein